MKEPFRDLAHLDRTVHAPPRLAILTVLMSCDRTDFMFLTTATGLTKGNLASNLTHLEEAGLITTDKELRGNRTRTTIRLTNDGQRAIANHWATLENLKKQTVPIFSGA